MNVSSCMKRNVVSIPANATVQHAVELAVKYHIGTLPVVDKEGKLLGIVNLKGLLSLVMPDFVQLIDNIDFLSDFGAVEKRRPSDEDLHHIVHDIMEKPICVKENSSLLHAAAMLSKHILKDIPVITEDGILIGLVSHVDIGTALMETWKLV
ncbi:MAG: CBS domain-containing protein [Anaerolineaceae bacterium]|nr:CBS domain-containing protein [Anaerolineaceae bacterium]